MTPEYWVILHRKGPFYKDSWAVVDHPVEKYREWNVNGQGHVLYGIGPFASLNTALAEIPPDTRGLTKLAFLRQKASAEMDKDQEVL